MPQRRTAPGLPGKLTMAGLLVTMLATTIGWTSAASASAGLPAGGRSLEHHRDAGPPGVTVTLDDSTPFTIPGPDPRPAGPVTFHVTTADGTDHWFSGITLAPGVTSQQAVQEIEESFSPDPSVALPALRAVYQDVIFVGGLSVIPADDDSWFTENFTPGTYVMSDAPAGSDNSGGQRTTLLTVSAPAGPGGDWARLPRIDAVLTVRESGANAAFIAPPRMPADGTFLAVNGHTSQPYEFLLREVNPGTTDADLQAYFDAVRAGQAPASNPFMTTDQQGLLPISPGHAAVFHASFPPGRYALLSYVRDPATGVARAYEGTFKIVTLY